ncbi:MAG: SDR family NAD(P)-dependent oxidoreductase [Arenicellales bacterium WSBS_2016_MAG_OTU3]
MFEQLFSLAGRTALVTGASSGLGECFAQTLARAGASVVLAARRKHKLESLAENIRSQNGLAYVVELDVSDAASVENAIQDAVKQAGAIDILVNNSGVASSGHAIDLRLEEWDRVVNTNLRGAWLVAQTLAKQMIANETGGSIINIASILSLRVAQGVAPYIASKAGLEHLTKALSLEWARYKIRVNAIAPGYIRTPMNEEFFTTQAGQNTLKLIPQRRMGEPSDLDGALLLLASNASGFMTGSTIVVDGGHMQSSL